MKASEARKVANKYAIKGVLDEISNISKQGKVQTYLQTEGLDYDFIKSNLETLGYLVIDEILIGRSILNPDKEIRHNALLIKW